MRISAKPATWSVTAALAFAVAGAFAITSAGLAQQPPAGGPQGGGRQGGGRQGPGPGGFQRPSSPPFPDAAQVVETLGVQLRVVPLFKGLFSLERNSLEKLLDTHPRVVYQVMRAVIRSVHGTLSMNIQYVEMSNYINKQHGRY